MANTSKFPGFLPHCLVGTTLLLSTIAGCSKGSPEAAQQGPPVFPVQVQSVGSSRVESASEFVGALEARRKVVLRPEIDGRILNLLVSSGDTVRAGTPIVQLKADQSQAEVSGASADVEAALAARNTAQAQLRAAQADRERAAANAQLENTDFQRAQSLVSEGAESQQFLDRARNERDTARAALDAATQNVRAALAAVNEANARLSRAQADRASARADLGESRVVAPIDGVVGNISVKAGDYVTTSDTITNIIQNQTLDLNISVPIERATELRTGLPVQLVNEQNQPQVAGQISFISPQVNTSEQSVLAKASFPNNGRLRDGQFVRARLIWSSEPGILVPTTAVTRVAGNTFIYVAESGEKAPSGEAQQVARQRPVKLGAIQGNSYQVESGLNPGDQIIVSGILNLSDGAPITIGQSADPQSNQQSSNAQ